MLRCLTDENFNGHVVRGLLRHLPDLDLLRVQDVGLMETDDALILEWAAKNERVFITHDIATTRELIYQRIAEGLPMPGVIYAPQSLSIGATVKDLIFLCGRSGADEFSNRIAYLPLRS